MFQKVIYKRQYNKPTIEEIEAEIADEPIPAEVKEPAPSKDKCSSKDIFKQLNEGVVYVPLPERKPIASIFTLTHYTGTEGRCVPDYFGLCIAQAFYYCATIQELEIYFEFSDG